MRIEDRSIEDRIWRFLVEVYSNSKGDDQWRSFEVFGTWKYTNLARASSESVFDYPKTFPREERYSLTDQIRRSSRAVNAIIAESWAKRKYPDAFVYKLYDAMGETMESHSWLDHSVDCNYIDQSRYDELDNGWQHIGAMLNRMVERADSFCKPIK